MPLRRLWEVPRRVAGEKSEKVSPAAPHNPFFIEYAFAEAVKSPSQLLVSLVYLEASGSFYCIISGFYLGWKDPWLILRWLWRLLSLLESYNLAALRIIQRSLWQGGNS